MAQLTNYIQPIVVYLTTGVSGVSAANSSEGSTGVALVLSTGGSSGSGSFSSGPGGFPWASTAAANPAVSLVGFDGVRFTAIVNSFSTGNQITMQLYAAKSSTSSSTTWSIIKDAYAIGYSTGGGGGSTGSPALLVVDLYRPNFSTGGFTAVGAMLQFPSSSGQQFGLIADRYLSKKEPVGTSTGFIGLASTAVDAANVIRTSGSTSASAIVAIANATA